MLISRLPLLGSLSEYEIIERLAFATDLSNKTTDYTSVSIDEAATTNENRATGDADEISGAKQSFGTD